MPQGQNTGLTLEQQFQLQVLKTQVKNLTLEESQEYLLEMFRQMMVKEEWMARILKNCA
ncbi:MAG: NblA/ycf18 family protein [Xenococcus sp. MO_188.B8]|nr:NblA/ycf18 family protein [Xenococcus sp. MO_188.B8]